jgi:hypothetical protein
MNRLIRFLRISVQENTGQDRLKAWAFMILLLAVLIMARLVTPDPRGLGTHTQLHLPPCTFQVTVGLPCPACGLTTSFAHMARGQVGRAFQVNVIGPPAFTGVLIFMLYQIWILLAGRHFELEWSVKTVGLVGLGLLLAMALYGAWRIAVIAMK